MSPLEGPHPYVAKEAAPLCTWAAASSIPSHAPRCSSNRDPPPDTDHSLAEGKGLRDSEPQQGGQSAGSKAGAP